MAIFVRTDFPTPPGTASISTLTRTTPSTTTVSLTFYDESLAYLSPYERATFLSTTVSLAKRSVVVAMATLSNAFSSSEVCFELWIGGTRVNYTQFTERIGHFIVVGYRTLPPGNHAVEAKFYNSSEQVSYGVRGYAPSGDKVIGRLAVVVVPLE